MRRDAREAAYKILYAERFNDEAETDESFKNEIFSELKLGDADKAFAETLINAANGHKEEIKEIISEYAKGYSADRLYSTDGCALTLAIAEMKFVGDVPPVVTVDEILFLVRKYSTEESLKFVNGVLAAIVKGRAEQCR